MRVKVYLYSLTSAINGVDGQHHTPADLPAQNSRHTLWRRLDEPHIGYARMR